MAFGHKDILEGLLYTAGDEGIESKQLQSILDISEEELKQLVTSYDSNGLMIHQFGSTYVLTTKQEVSPYIEKLVKQQSNMKLSQAAMEVLSIIAYNQPVTRSDIEIIRGINSDGAAKTLIARGLIEAKEEENSRSQQLYTTPLFLNVFGMKDLDELPTTEDEEEEIASFFNNLINQKGENDD